MGPLRSPVEIDYYLYVRSTMKLIYIFLVDALLPVQLTSSILQFHSWNPGPLTNWGQE